MSARLTIAIPTFNRSALLRVALESALAQTSQDIEILVSDNGSADDTPAVISRYQDRRLRAIRRDVTVSRAAHGAIIFAQIHTELVLVLSDDDYLEPEFAGEVIALFDRHPEISFAYTGCIEHYDNEMLPALVGPPIEPGFDFMLAHFQGFRQVSWCACVTRAADLRRLGPQPPDRLIGDMFFWTKIAFQGPVGCVARPLAHYSVLRPSGDNESRQVPILTWGREVALIAQEVLAMAAQAGADPRQLAELRAASRRYIVRSLANQFLWARIAGMNRRACIAELPQCLKFDGWTVQSIVRVAGALVLSRRMLRAAVLNGIAKLAKQRPRR
jgi:hypothetical protein